MVTLSNEAIEDFIALYKASFGIDLDNDAARALAGTLIDSVYLAQSGILAAKQ